MKKIVLLAALAIFGVTSVNAQKDSKKAAASKVVTPKVDGAGMVFENETIDYGTIQHNANGDREFVFTNNGNKPLKIESTQGSFGCTVPQKPEGDIAPGAKGVIKVHFNQYDDHFTLQVIDSGEGMSVSMAQYLLTGTSKDEVELLPKYKKGNGIGYQIIRHLVKLMKANLFIDSKEGIGTSIKIIFYHKKLK